MRSLAFVFVLLFAALSGGPARATKEMAKAHFQSGTHHYNLSKFEEAIRDFEKAYAAYPSAAFLYNIAQSYRRLGRCEARWFYEKYLSEASEVKNRREVARQVRLLAYCEQSASNSSEISREKIVRTSSAAVMVPETDPSSRASGSGSVSRVVPAPSTRAKGRVQPKPVWLDLEVGVRAVRILQTEEVASRGWLLGTQLTGLVPLFRGRHFRILGGVGLGLTWASAQQGSAALFFRPWPIVGADYTRGAYRLRLLAGGFRTYFANLTGSGFLEPGASSRALPSAWSGGARISFHRSMFQRFFVLGISVGYAHTASKEGVRLGGFGELSLGLETGISFR